MQPFERWVCTVALKLMLLVMTFSIGIPAVRYSFSSPSLMGEGAIVMHVIMSMWLAIGVLHAVWNVGRAHEILAMLQTLDGRAPDTPKQTVEWETQRLLATYENTQYMHGGFMFAYVVVSIPVAAMVYWRHPFAFEHAGLHLLMFLPLMYAAMVSYDAVETSPYKAAEDARRAAFEKKRDQAERIAHRLKRAKEHQRVWEIMEMMDAGKTDVQIEQTLCGRPPGADEKK